MRAMSNPSNPSNLPRVERARVALRWLLALAMVTVGVLHFTNPAPFVSIMPPPLERWAIELVWISGGFEVLGGLGILPTRTRRAAGWGLIALYVAVFPANIYMAVAEVPFNGEPVPAWAAWGRLPFQVVFIAWAWWVAASSSAQGPSKTR